MPRMMRELQARPDAGLLGSISMGTTMVQYWQSAEKLIAYASDRTGAHYPAWAEFYRRVGKNGDVGIWHETYVVPRHAFESVYVNMPAHGMGTFAKLEPARGKRARAAERLGCAPLETHTADVAS
jgi:esterase/lipase superfamily enzyme